MPREIEWFHYAPTPEFVLDRTRTYEPRRIGKPGGLWISPVEDGWRAWRESEGWGIPDMEYVYRVTLRDDANLLTLESWDIPSLADRFPLPEPARWRFHHADPDWGAIMAAYDGVLIPEYHWCHRMDINWYYGWDCASGCIWNLDAIDAVTFSHTLTRPAESADNAEESAHAA